jgi:flagellar hook protein FlgE
MLRSLYSGVSGLQSHQVAMDVIGNNISNVNTTGFKSGRTTFEEQMSQTLQGASRPVGGMGGINAMQVGLGVSPASIDTMLTQGSLQSTGQITDLAIEGRAYFVFSNGAGNVYGRNGGLQFDATGRLVSPTNGYCLQGMTAATDGTYPPGSKIGDIRIPFGEKAPARATTEVKFQCNLDSDSEALGTITHTNRFLATADGAQPLTSVFDQNGNNLGITDGDNITISMTGSPSQSIPVTATTSLADLATSIGAYLTANGATAAVSVNAAGQIAINNTGGAINGLQIGSTRPISDSFIASTFSFNSSIPAGTTVQSGTMLRPAIATDALSTVLDANGQTLGFEAGDVININGSVGGKAVTTGSLTYGAATTVGDLLTAIQTTFRLPPTDGTAQNNPSVSINAADSTNDMLPDGSIVIRGQPENAFAITSVSIGATNANQNATSPARFIANAPFTPVQDARDTGVHSASIKVYDESGDAHTLVMTFTKTQTPNEWLWQASTEGGETILGGGNGVITFGQDGSPASFTYADGSTNFRFDPMNGSNIVAINLNTGVPGSLQGVTGFRSPTTTIAKEQDGYTMGKLQDIQIDEKGEVMGQYSNGVTKSIARIYLAEFNNPGGLLKAGDSMFAVSNNSGMALLQRPGIGTTSTIKAGTLEMSNVDLATQFTDMIVTQRGYQANSKVITTSDQMLQELLQLVR